MYKKRPIEEEQNCADIHKKSLIRQTNDTKRDLLKKTIYAQRSTHRVWYKRCTRIRKETYHSAPPCNTLQHLATPCNTPCNTLATKGDALVHYLRRVHMSLSIITHCVNILHHAITRCNTLQHPAIPCNTP